MPNSQDETKALEIISSLRKAIWSRRPILGEIMGKHGGKTLYRYARDFLDVNKSPLLDSRKTVLIETARDLIEKRLGKEIAEGVAIQLKKIALVSTADHHAPIDNPFWVNANIISAVPYFEITDPDIHYLIVFSFSSVSVNNSSGYPRGIEFHGANGLVNFIKLPILPDKLKMGVVYGTRSFIHDDLTRAKNELFKKKIRGEFSENRYLKIKELIENVFGSKKVLQSQDFCSQITNINFHLWPKLFRPSAKKIPDLVYLDIETLVTELLSQHHLNNPQSLIYQLLFNSDYARLVLKYFNNLAGGFSLEKDWGTYLFWATDSKLHRVRLLLEENFLVSRTRGYKFSLFPESIADLLRQKKIFPSMLLCYLVVSLYYGMKCLGGFCQVHDLTMIKTAWNSILRERGESAEADAITPVQTKELGGDGLVLAYLKTEKDVLMPATGIDMALGDTNASYKDYVELSKKVTLAEMMNPMLLEMYTVLYSSYQRDPNLLKIKPEQILKTTGLERILSF
ncbi:hypothetical protein HZC21_05235 [Candidatus Peregrinibacteria bacterium]|nr:hypothetical protein [Candidatus Peregrinibacteria bacterium]